MKTITVNGVTYPAKEFDYNLMCDFEDMGVSIEEIGEKPMASMRAYVAVCMGKSKDVAGLQIEEHISSGEGLDDIFATMVEQIEASDFFRRLNEREEQKDQKNASKKRPSKKVTED